MGFGYDGGIGLMLYKAMAFIIASCVFSIIFWSTKTWLDEKAKKKKK